ncbi:MAG: hypothetical protein J0L84_14225 [Verrucomicrobia bacterium]|nr:hypothetical protein [Verrucomicrobiota bacterium]
MRLHRPDASVDNGMRPEVSSTADPHDARSTGVRRRLRGCRPPPDFQLYESG